MSLEVSIRCGFMRLCDRGVRMYTRGVRFQSDAVLCGSATCTTMCRGVGGRCFNPMRFCAALRQYLRLWGSDLRVCKIMRQPPSERS
jgi:hypothetical protein